MKDKLFRFAVGLLRNVEEAEDAVQDVMVNMWAKREQWGELNNLAAYCMTAVRNSCLDRLRKRRIVSVQEDSASGLSSPEKNPQESMMDKEMVQRIRACMELLPANQQQVIRLREMEGFSYNEIAEILGLSLDQVKVNLFRARTTIKKLITKEEGIWDPK